MRISSSLGRVDVLVFGLIACFGVLQLFSPLQVPDFQNDDVFYADAGRSIVQHGYYGINGHSEANQPPGLPALLGVLYLLGLSSHADLLRAMAILETLGFLATYELLRRQTSRIVAASICVLLISSTIYFSLATQWVFPSFFYFLISTCALLVARKFDTAANSFSRVSQGTLLAFLIMTSLLIASAGMAFLAAICAAITTSAFRNRRRAFQRAKRYAAIFLLGAAVQGLWMHRKAPPLEWPLPGYPQSYLSQLKVKSGNQPELGMATLKDIPIRVLTNAANDSILLVENVFHFSIAARWMSVFVTGPILLTVFGWGASVWRRGGDLQAWYFAAYQLIYLLWPWQTEPRFFLPIAPLACFYLWRGCEAFCALARHRRRILGAAFGPVAVILSFGSWFWLYSQWTASQKNHASLQAEFSFAMWVGLAVLSMRTLVRQSSQHHASAPLGAWFSRPIPVIGLTLRSLLLSFGLAAILILTVAGLHAQLRLSRAHRDPESPANRITPDVLAAQWINRNTRPDAVIMARHVPISFHYCGRNTIWFPPSSNANLLIEGIKKNKVDYAIVISREESYYLPAEEDSMSALLAADPTAMELIHQGPGFRIYRASGMNRD